jgi:hypothetical protein
MIYVNFCKHEILQFSGGQHLGNIVQNSISCERHCPKTLLRALRLSGEDRKRRLGPLAPFMPVGLGGETAVTQALRRSPCLHLVRGDASKCVSRPAN